MNRGERLSTLFWTAAIFAVLLWSGAAMCDMSIPDFSMHVVGPFVADYPWAPIVLVAVIIVLLFDDVLDRLICALWDGVAYLLTSRAKTADSDAQTRRTPAARQVS